MDNKELQEKWPVIQQKILADNPHLTQEELRLEIGKEAELLERLQEKLKKNKKEIDYYLALMG